MIRLFVHVLGLGCLSVGEKAYFCPVMDWDMERGGIMSSRYSRCLSAKLDDL